MQKITSSLGLSYLRRGRVSLRDKEDLSSGRSFWHFFSHFLPSENMRVAEDILSGIYKGHEVMACVVHGVDNDIYTYFKINHQRGYPPLVIWDKRKTHKTWAKWLAFGQNPLAQEFSKSFRVYSPDESFARNACHPDMMKYLLALHEELERTIDKVEILGHSIFMRQEGYHVDKAETRLNQLVEIYSLLSHVMRVT